jgi:hypothetical protein
VAARVNATTIGSLAVALTAVLGAVGSVLLLAYRVGKLTGSAEARLQAGVGDRRALWEAVGVLTGRFDRHIEQPHQRRKR